MITVRVVEDQMTYASIRRRKGDEIDMPDSDAHALVGIGKVAWLEDRVMAEPEPAPKRRGRPPIHGRYARRDLRAKE